MMQDSQTQMSKESFIGEKELTAMQATIAMLYAGNVELGRYRQNRIIALNEIPSALLSINSKFGTYVEHQHKQLLELKAQYMDLQFVLQIEHNNNN